MREEYALLLLAGGKSSRMGKDKAGLFYEGATFTETLLEKAGFLGIRKKYLSGHETQITEVVVVPDRYENRGPLGGIHAGLLAAEASYCLVLPVDVPQIPLAVLERLFEEHKALSREERKKPLLLRHAGRTEPLIGIYPVEIADRIGKVIQNQAAPVFRLLEQWGYNECRADFAEEWQGENINTPQAYQELLRHQKD